MPRRLSVGELTRKCSATLDGEWKAVEEATAAEKAAMRFFKVVVVQ